MLKTGQDSVRSWMVALCCSLISMLLYGVVRLSGSLFVASMDRFKVDRQAASLPYILCDCLQSMAGPVTGFLSLKFGTMSVMMSGSFVAAVGIGACFLAENIETVTFFWGVVYGLGFGLSSLLLPLVITQHFIKKRATAISMVYVGSYVGFSFLPALVEFLIDTYGLSGTFLLLSGIILHCVPLSMLMYTPKDIPQTDQFEKNLIVERARASSISVVDKHRSCFLNESKCSWNDKIFQDIQPISSENTATSKVEIEEHSTILISNSIAGNEEKTQDSKSNHSVRDDILNSGDLKNVTKPNTAKTSIYGVINEAFSYEEITKYDLKETEILSTSKEIYSGDGILYNVEDTPNTTKQFNSKVENEELSDQNSSKINLNELQYLNPVELSQPEFKTKWFQSITDFNELDLQLLSVKRKSSSLSGTQTETQLRYCTKPVNYKKDDHHTRVQSSNDFLNTSTKTVKISGSVNKPPSLRDLWKTNKRASNSLDYSQECTSVIAKLSEHTPPISRAFRIFLEPIFLLVLVCTAIYAASFIAFITVVVDFTQDIGLPETDGKFVIMAFSIASNFGLLSFGWVTDGGYLSLTNFAGLMFFLRSITLCFIPYSGGFGFLLAVVALQGFFESSLANMFPLIVAEYYIDEIHELAISCTLFLCGPMHLATPPLIGLCRDGLGTYLYLFLLMALLSFICSILLFLAPLLAQCRCERDDWILRVKESTQSEKET